MKKIACKDLTTDYQNSVSSGLPTGAMFTDTFEEMEPNSNFQERFKFRDTVPLKSKFTVKVFGSNHLWAGLFKMIIFIETVSQCLQLYSHPDLTNRRPRLQRTSQ
jgi:hypothetical protein